MTHCTDNQIWTKFINGEEIDTSLIRPEVLASWKRCQGKVDPFKKGNHDILIDSKIKKILNEQQELITIAYPMMEDLYDVVRNSGIAIGLLAVKDNGLYSVVNFYDQIGDEEAKLKCVNFNDVAGSNWTEEVMGTWAGSLAFYYDKPFQIGPSECYCECLKVGIACGVPIHDPDTVNIIGVLIIHGSVKNVYPHTLGMAVSTAKSIEKQIATTRLKNIAEIDKNYKNLILESTPYGVICFDDNMVITHVNERARNVLGIQQEIIGHNIFSVMTNNSVKPKIFQRLLDIIKSNLDVSDEFVYVQTAFGPTRCAVTTRGLHSHNKNIGKVLLINEMSRYSHIVRTLGNQARFTFKDIIGEDKKLIECIETGIRVSKTSSNVLILGESGTGKDLFAQSIHNASNRFNQPYIAINCAAIPRELMASEIFGYEEGAFTGAKKGGNPGKFELADGGTIFLDEIGEMPIDMQSMLLRVLEEGTVTRLGGKLSVPTNVRLITATNKDLSKEVEKSNFRGDLYYRLNVISINLPPLRERKGDIPLFITKMAENISARLGKKIHNINLDLIMCCSLYDWPGNIRELQNAIERCINLAEGSVLTIEYLPDHIKNFTVCDEIYPANKILKKYGKAAEYSVILDCLEKHGGNKTKVARELGITRTTLYRKLNEINDNSNFAL
jgi:transcriptional regulator with PAS, ATPase and Fis domain